MLYIIILNANLDISSMRALLASLVVILIGFAGYLLLNAKEQFKERLKGKDDVIDAMKVTIADKDKLLNAIQLRLDKEQEYNKTQAINMTKVLQDNTNYLRSNSKEVDRINGNVISSKEIIKENNGIIKDVRKYQEKL